jgi:hypothetical protein
MGDFEKDVVVVKNMTISMDVCSYEANRVGGLKIFTLMELPSKTTYCSFVRFQQMENSKEMLEDVLNDEPEIKRDYRVPAKLKYEPITFIKASETESPAIPPKRLGDLYLSLVFPSSSTPTETQSAPISPIQAPKLEVCLVCNLPLSEDPKHATSIAHQACLPHSHPPSALDRRRKGLAYLKDYGWDPDARVGLGEEGRQGMLYPIIPKAKKGRAGIVETLDEDAVSKKRKPPLVQEKVKMKNAKQMKKDAVEDRKRREKITRLLYMDDNVLKHLGEEF